MVGALVGLALGGAVSCTTGAKKDVAKTALDAMPADERLETFEATARVLDERPELVDFEGAQVACHLYADAR